MMVDSTAALLAHRKVEHWVVQWADKWVLPSVVDWAVMLVGCSADHSVGSLVVQWVVSSVDGKVVLRADKLAESSAAN